jgi:hypothetical protein
MPTFYQNYLAMRNTANVTGGKPVAVLLQSISGVSAINPIVAFYDIHGGKRKVLFFYFVTDTSQDRETSSKERFIYLFILNQNVLQHLH